MPESFFLFFNNRQKTFIFFERPFDFLRFLLSKVIRCQVDSITSRHRDIGERERSLWVGTHESCPPHTWDCSIRHSYTPKEKKKPVIYICVVEKFLFIHTFIKILCLVFTGITAALAGNEFIRSLWISFEAALKRFLLIGCSLLISEFFSPSFLSFFNLKESEFQMRCFCVLVIS